MLKSLIIVPVLFFLSTGTSIAEAPLKEPLDTKEEYVEFVHLKAEQYGVSADLMISIINCENRDWNPTLQSYAKYKNGEREKSYGLAQIHLPAHPSISYEQATNPEFSINFLAENLAEGKGSMWSCYAQVKSPH